MTIFGFHFHSFEPIYSRFMYHYLDKPILRLYETHRRCKECGQLQGSIDYGEDIGFRYSDLTKQEADILNSMLITDNDGKLIVNKEPKVRV